MPGVVEYPEIVNQTLGAFSDLFSYEPQRRHFAEYLTGLLIASRKTVSGINREFPDSTDQSCLNRFLTSSPWNVADFNFRRLELLQQNPETRYSPHGSIPIDNTLIDREGKLIPDAGWFWDHCEERHKIAQDYIFVNYVCPSGLHYPLQFCTFRKADACQADNTPFKDHTQLACELIDWVCEQKIPGTFTFDCYFACADILNHINGKSDEDGSSRRYVGDFKSNRCVIWKGKKINLTELASLIKPETRKPIRSHLDGPLQYYFTATLDVPKIDHRVRVVILWNERTDNSPKKILVTNQIHWEAVRITREYRKRWTGTEPFHRDCKQELGMGDCQLRDKQGQTRHMHFVMLAYSLMVNPVLKSSPRDWLFRRLKTVGEACRAIKDEVLRRTIAWVVDEVVKRKKPLNKVFSELGLLDTQTA